MVAHPDGKEPYRQVAESRRQFARDPDAAFRLRAVTLMDRQERAYNRALEILRDARWKLMALRAKKEAQQGKVFDSAEALAHYLDSL